MNEEEEQSIVDGGETAKEDGEEEHNVEGERQNVDDGDGVEREAQWLKEQPCFNELREAQWLGEHREDDEGLYDEGLYNTMDMDAYVSL